jgi:hypothetical protein
MSDAAQIYIELGADGAEKYDCLIKEEDRLLCILQATDSVDNKELLRVRNEIYELRQDARLVSSR